MDEGATFKKLIVVLMLGGAITVLGANELQKYYVKHPPKKRIDSFLLVKGLYGDPTWGEEESQRAMFDYKPPKRRNSSSDSSSRTWLSRVVDQVAFWRESE